MESLVLDVAVWWLLAGAILILLEVMLVPGIGFLFAGLAAVIVGGLISIDVIARESTQVQFIWFFLFTGFWAAVLWVPMKRLRYKTSGDSYKNIVGDIAIVFGAPLTQNQYGKVKWSGTTMKARIAKDCDVASIPEGTEVEIVDIDGSKVYVKPRSNSNKG